MNKPTAGHMHKLRIEMPDDTHMNQEWTFWADGKEAGSMTFQFDRVK